jgi:serine/threonine protein phosphatase PrpC
MDARLLECPMAKRSAGISRTAPAEARTHVGLVRESNEDAVAIAAAGRLLVCADGLGGLPRGELAASMAVEHVVGAIGPLLRPGAGRGPNWPQRLQRAFHGAQKVIREAVEEDPSRGEMGTALIAAVVGTHRAYVCHVGDVRAYLHGNGGLRRLTDDHSLVFEAVRQGRLTVEQARRHPKRNVVTQAIGLAEGVTPEINTTALASGDVLLLCSDGLWETVADHELARLFATSGSPAALAAALIDLSLEAGAPDNVSVVVYRHP